MSIRVIVIEDHPLVLDAIVEKLAVHDDIEVVGTALRGSKLHSLVRETDPDVVVLDLGMATETFEPIGAVRTLRYAHPDVQVLVLTGQRNSFWMRELIAAGALGYVLKHDDLSMDLPKGVRTVYRGERFYSKTVLEKHFQAKDIALSAQERAVLRLVARGFANEHIGGELNMAEKTVRNVLSSVYHKLSVKGVKKLNPRMAAVSKAQDLGLLED